MPSLTGLGVFSFPFPGTGVPGYGLFRPYGTGPPAPDTRLQTALFIVDTHPMLDLVKAEPWTGLQPEHLPAHGQVLRVRLLSADLRIPIRRRIGEKLTLPAEVAHRIFIDFDAQARPGRNGDEALNHEVSFVG